MESGEIGGEKESEGSEEDGIIEERNAKIPRKNGAEIGGERSDRQTNGTQLQEEFGADVKNEVFNCEMERNGRILEGNNKLGEKGTWKQDDSEGCKETGNCKRMGGDQQYDIDSEEKDSDNSPSSGVVEENRTFRGRKRKLNRQARRESSIKDSDIRFQHFTHDSSETKSYHRFNESKSETREGKELKNSMEYKYQRASRAQRDFRERRNVSMEPRDTLRDNSDICNEKDARVEIENRDQHDQRGVVSEHPDTSREPKFVVSL